MFGFINGDLKMENSTKFLIGLTCCSVIAFISLLCVAYSAQISNDIKILCLSLSFLMAAYIALSTLAIPTTISFYSVSKWLSILLRVIFYVIYVAAFFLIIYFYISIDIEKEFLILIVICFMAIGGLIFCSKELYDGIENEWLYALAYLFSPLVMIGYTFYGIGVVFTFIFEDRRTPEQIAADEKRQQEEMLKEERRQKEELLSSVNAMYEKLRDIDRDMDNR